MITLNLRNLRTREARTIQVTNDQELVVIDSYKRKIYIKVKDIQPEVDTLLMEDEAYLVYPLAS